MVEWQLLVADTVLDVEHEVSIVLLRVHEAEQGDQQNRNYDRSHLLLWLAVRRTFPRESIFCAFANKTIITMPSINNIIKVRHEFPSPAVQRGQLYQSMIISA